MSRLITGVTFYEISYNYSPNNLNLKFIIAAEGAVGLSHRYLAELLHNPSRLHFV